MQLDRKFWRHPGVWKIPTIIKDDAYLPTIDFFIGTTNMALQCALFTFYYWEQLLGIIESHFATPFFISAVIQALIIMDWGGFSIASDSMRSDAATKNLIREIDSNPVALPIKLLVAPRLRSFASKVRAVKSDNG